VPPERPPFCLRLQVALRGLWIAYRDEPNLRFQVFAGTAAAVVGWAVGLSGWEVAYLVLTIGLVLFAELVNTALERTVDLAGQNRSSTLAGDAKDIAAGAVLLTSLHALLAGVWLFAVQRSLLVTLHQLVDLLVARPWAAALLLLAAFGWLWLGRSRALSN